MRKTLRGKYVVVSTKMRSNSVYSKGAYWEKQGLNPGFNFFLCLREKEVFFFFFLFFLLFFLCFSPGWPQVKRANWYQLACSTGGQTEPKKKSKEKERKNRLVMAEGQYVLVRSTLGKTKFGMFKACHDGMT